MATLYAWLALATFITFRLGQRRLGLALFAATLILGWFTFAHHASNPLPLSF